MQKNGALHTAKSLLYFFIEYTLLTVLFITLFLVTALFRLFFVLYQYSIGSVISKKYQTQYHPIKN